MTLMKISRIALAIGLIIVALIALAAQTAAMAADAPARTMTLTGTGTVYATPDKAVITIGVSTEAKTAAAALRENTASMQAVMKLLAEQGLEPKDIQTANFSVNPRTVYPNKDRSLPPQVVGYTVSNEVRATIRDLDKIGPILDQAVSAGSNSINNIRFAVTDPDPLYDEARRLAVRDAMRKAKLFAEEAGVTLQAITSISEVNVGVTQPVYQRTLAAASAESAVPIAAGQQTLQMRVNIVWSLGD